MNHALLYARLGWAVVPIHSVRPDGSCSCGHSPAPNGSGCLCGSPKCRQAHGAGSTGKHPRLRDWPAQASSDPEDIAEWWRQWPGSNVGIATGAASGVVVLDVDGAAGADTLARLEAEHGPLPRTTQAVTGSGGAHYVFRAPAFPVTNSAGALGKGLDIRGDGGQIVVAQSISARGAYRWVAGRAPWETPSAELPTWLLELLRRAPAASASSGAPGRRGYFPPASPAVLEAAREALELHGPAVDGDGGGLHTVQAGSILTHDYALTDEEAWPLFEEWNATCVPPWELDELRERLRRGEKYGKLPYGCKRPMETVEAARRLIAEWQAGPNPAETVFDLVEAVRPLAGACTDVTRHASIAKELSAATGFAVKNLGLPKPTTAPKTEPKQGEIQVTPNLKKTADESLVAITPYVFARNGVLCEVVQAEPTWIQELKPARILDLMSQAAVYVRQDEAKGTVIQAPPDKVAEILHARRTHPAVRVLQAVTSAPVFLSDGSILQERGYNAQARVFLEPNVHVEVPERPDLADARAAVALFRDIVCDFRFATVGDFSSWLAAVLSPLVKAATDNAPAPLVCISASSPGAGKTLLAEVVAWIVTGAGAEVRPYNPSDAAEHGKRLTAFVKAGSPVNVFDNVNGDFGDEALDKLLTASTWSDRQLGASDAPPLPMVSTWLATGNNISPVRDTVRRILMVRLDVLEDRPQERTGFRRPLLLEHVRRHRAELLGAALTILRAYHCAGRPDQRLPSWGSFMEWSALVRGALVWAGCADPFDTQRRATLELGEPDNEAHDFWIATVEASDGTPAGVVLQANQRGAREVLGAREPLTSHSLRRWLGRFLDKPRLGKRIRRREGRYVVERLP